MGVITLKQMVEGSASYVCLSIVSQPGRPMTKAIVNPSRPNGECVDHVEEAGEVGWE